MSAAVWQSEKLLQMETVIELYVSLPGDKVLVTEFWKKNVFPCNVPINEAKFKIIEQR